MTVCHVVGWDYFVFWKDKGLLSGLLETHIMGAGFSCHSLPSEVSIRHIWSTTLTIYSNNYFQP